jgi:hypothetical protein
MKEVRGEEDDNWKGKDKKIQYLGRARADGRSKRTTFVGNCFGRGRECARFVAELK